MKVSREEARVPGDKPSGVEGPGKNNRSLHGEEEGRASMNAPRSENANWDWENKSSKDGLDQEGLNGPENAPAAIREEAALPTIQNPVYREEGTGADVLESAESRVYGPRQPEPPKEAPSSESHLSNFATNLYTFSYLVFFSIFGALARIGLQALTFYPGAPVTTAVVWANVGGCILMGFFAEDRNIFREEWGIHNIQRRNAERQRQLSPEESLKLHKTIKKTIPLYIGLTTGFCGSFTSFSTFMRDAFLALSNDLHNPDTSSITSRNGGYSFMAVVAVLIYTVSLSMSALFFGSHIAVAIDKFTPTLPFTLSRKVLDRAMVPLALGCWLGAVFLAIWPPDRFKGVDQTWRGRAVFATVFAPPGALFRFYVSLLLNSRVPAFPLGTFTANIFGTLVEGMCYDLKYATHVVAATATYGRVTGCQVLDGVMDGFCGCLTTISTWVAELDSLELRHAYRYGFVSVAMGLAVMVVVMGSLRWTEGFGQALC